MGFFSRPTDPLDRSLFHWTKRDFFSQRDLLQSIAVFGQTGSGKSSGSGLLLARAIFGIPNSGGYIALSKPEDKQFWIDRAKEAGRLNDLIFFGRNESARWNFVDFEMQQGGDSRSLTQFLMVISESLSKGGSGHDGKFWELSKARILFCAIESCRQAWGKIIIPELQSFISTAGYHAGQFSDEKPKDGGQSPREKFESGFHYRTMKTAGAKPKTAIEKGDFALCTDYWINEFLNMDNKTRSAILADTMNVLFTYNTGIVRETVSTTTTASPRDMENGKFLVFDFPIDEFGDSGKLLMHGGKLSAQKYILRRSDPKSPIIIWCDEAQDMMSSFDAAFLAKCRSHKGAMIYLTQSLHSYFGEAKGAEGEHRAKALMTNFSHKIFHTLGDNDSAVFAASHLGQYRETFISYSPSPRETLGDDIFGHGVAGGNITESYQDVLKPVEFLCGLRQGGGINNYMVDGIVIRSGRQFSSGQNFLKVAFSQK